MARYRRIDVRIHFDQRVERLSPIPPCGEGLWHYLLTNPDGTMVPGLARCGRAAMAEALGWDPKAFDKAFGEVFREGLAEADWKARVVWVPNVIRYDPPGNPNVVRGWAPHWDEIPDCALKATAWETLNEWFVGDAQAKSLNPKIQNPKAFLEAFLEACPKPLLKASPKPSRMRALRIPEIRIQKQEQEKGVNACTTRAREDGTGAPPPDPDTHAPGNGKGNRGKEPPFDPLSVPLPAILDTPAFRTAWEARVRERAERAPRDRLRPEQTAAKLAKLAKLATKHGVEAATDCVTRATAAGWTGEVFAEDEAGTRCTTGNGGSGALSSTRKRWGSDLAPGTTLADVEAAREFDLKIFGPRETLDG